MANLRPSCQHRATSRLPVDSGSLINVASAPATPQNLLNSHQLASSANPVAPASGHQAHNVTSSSQLHHNAARGATNYRNHQRRQSVARLLPDISKLRLLSWLVEASNELINCNILIMDGVYAKLNKSQESLLFWQSLNKQPIRQAQAQQQQPPPTPLSQPIGSNNKLALISQQENLRKQLKKQARQATGSKAAARNHHSLPLTNYDASSMAAVSFLTATSSSSKSAALSRSLNQKKSASLATTGSKATGNGGVEQRDAKNVCSPGTPSARERVEPAPDCDHQQQQQQASSLNFNKSNDNSICDSNLQPSDLELDIEADRRRFEMGDEEEGDADDGASSSSASSSTSSSGHASSSLSSSVSSSSSSGGSSASSDANNNAIGTACNGNPANEQQELFVSPAERLSEKMRRIVMEHNYLQNLLVNIIRQHDKQRLELNKQRRRQLSLQQQAFSSSGLCIEDGAGQQLKIDLADTADALDDGCSCLCHSDEQHELRAFNRSAKFVNQEFSLTATNSNEPADSNGCESPSNQQQQLAADSVKANCKSPAATSGKSSTLPASMSARQRQVATNGPTTPTCSSANKVKRLKKFRSNLRQQAKDNLGRKELVELLSDKLCENCFETHYWLHGCSNELYLLQNELIFATNCKQFKKSDRIEQINNLISKRNASFIKLVQQEVRSTISKSIELIDLIRKEIKSPESIKQKQLMRCFSTSIQLLTSVGNYVVPSQDISSFIQPEFFTEHQQQSTATGGAAGFSNASLFSLPSSDFDHLLLYQTPSVASLDQNNCSNYHLASAPEIPIRRKAALSNQARLLTQRQQQQKTKSLQDNNQLDDALSVNTNKSTPMTSRKSSSLKHNPNNDSTTTCGETTAAVMSNNHIESSSGNSSNNSSASSSIARGTVQQSSLSRAQTSSAILDEKTSHDHLSYDAIANLSKHHHSRNISSAANDGDLLLSFQSKPKFWQNSKFNFIKKLLHVKEQRLLRQQSKDRRIYNNKVQNKFRLVMMDLTHFNKSQQLLTTENGVNSLLTSMRNVLEFGLYLTLKLY